MNLLRRRILYFFFILLFFILTPLVSLYANGYRFSSGFRFEKTGILIVDSEPRGAMIYIDNKIQRNFFGNIINRDKNYVTTPAKIKGVLPGEYEVRFEMEKYWPWQKKLEIASGQSTFAEDVSLFKKELPINILDGPSIASTFSPSNRYLVNLSKDNITLFNIENETKESRQTTRGTSSLIRWSESSEKIIYSDLLFDVNNWTKPLNLSDVITATNNSLVKWGEDDNQVYYSSDQGIHRYNIDAKLNKNIINESGINDFLIKNNSLFYIKQTVKDTQLSIYELDSSNKIIEAKKLIKQLTLPSSDYEFINQGHNLLNLYDKKFKILYLIDPSSPIRPLRETINNTTESLWVTDTKLLYANDFEIWLYDLESFNKIILTRISNKIDNIIWHPNNNYIIYNTNNNINIIELDNREKYNVTNLINLDNIKNLHLNDEGDVLYFYSKIGNQEGIYKLFIQ